MQGYDLIISQGKAACAVADYAARAGVPVVRFVAGTYLVSALSLSAGDMELLPLGLLPSLP